MKIFGRALTTFLLKHGYQLLFLLLLISVNIMCIFLPIFSVVALFFIAPTTAYFMRRYIPFVPLIIYPIFGVISHFTTGNNVYLYFVPIFVFTSLGLYYALKTRIFYRAITISISCVFLSMIFSTGMCMILARNPSFISAVQNEVFYSESRYVRGEAEAYFNIAFPEEEDKELFRLPEGVEVVEGFSEEEFAVRYVYAAYVASVLKTRLVMYMVKLSVLLGFGGYIIASLLCKHLKCEQAIPVRVEEVRLPKGFGLYSILAVAIGYALSFAFPSLYPAHLAIYHGAMLAPFAVYGVCFSVYIARLLPFKPLQVAVICAIIIVAAASFMSEYIIIIYAILGVADYFVNFRKLLKMLSE